MGNGILDQDIKSILKISRQIRKKCERLQESQGIWFDDLCGMCGIASGAIFEKCKIEHPSLTVQIGLSDTHAFTIINNRIIDVTATQFDRKYSKVCVVSPKTMTYVPFYWKVQDIFHNIEEFHQEQLSWREEERYITYRDYFVT